MCLIFSAAEVSKMTAAVHGVLAGVPVPFPIDNNNACKDCGLTCPLAAGASATYTYQLPVKSAYPSVSYYSLLPDSDCFTIKQYRNPNFPSKN